MFSDDKNLQVGILGILSIFLGASNNLELLSNYNNVSQDLGFGSVKPVNPRNAGAADISFTSGHLEMAIDGLGLTGGSGDHTINETGDLNTVAQKAKIDIKRLKRELLMTELEIINDELARTKKHLNEYKDLQSKKSKKINQEQKNI